MKFSISSKAKKFKPTKRKIVITAAVITILALLGLSMVHQVRVERHNKAVAAQQATERADSEAQTKATISKLEASNTALQADKTSLCQNYDALSKARATRSLVVTPTVCTIKR